MKNKKKLVGVLTILCAMILTACANKDVQNKNLSTGNEVTENRQISNEAETNAVDVEPETEADLTDFSQLVSFYETDPNYDPQRMMYEIYVQKVKVSAEGESDRTEVIVAGRAMNTEGKTQEATIAAKEAYVDSSRTDGPIIEAKTQWWNQGVPYSADSIIEAALEECGISQDEMNLYHRYILASTF